MIKTIVFLGPDGSGKSTIIKMLENDLREFTPKLNIKIIHFRPQLKKKNVYNISLPYNKKSHNNFLSIIKLFIWCIIYNIYFIKKYVENYSRKLIIIFDRHLLDIKIDPLRYRINEKVNKLPFYQFLYPKPDIIFYLDATPEIINNRKKEVTLSETQLQINNYKKVLKYVKNVFIVNNEGNIHLSYNTIKNKLIEIIKIENSSNS